MDAELEGALQVAVAVALDAGAMLRAEFHRPGGPRGHGNHADVDEEVERTVAARLGEAFPAWGFQGEETLPSGHGDPRWMVDPNDGTAAFLRGFRGNAVSIGLLRGFQPVLGVVYAPTAPDDRGDLITWAQGGPLMRNGTPFERSPLPRELRPCDVVFVSQDADRTSRDNAECARPARFRALPSIAYRLALVAAGEGEAAVSLSAPTGWDVAAGHALLRAVGGELLDDRGRPFVYPAEGYECHDVFGGSPDVARTLIHRDWKSVTGMPRTDEAGPLGRWHLARARKGEAVSDAGALARAQGCLLGQVAGDSLGARVEFESPRLIQARHKDGVRDLQDGGPHRIIAGQPTDDSEMALMLARAIDQVGEWDSEIVLDAYYAWMESGPFDIGNTTREGLSGTLRLDSQANGSLMRISPLGVFGWVLPAADVARRARDDSALTHPHPVCRDSAAAFAVAIAFAVRTGATPEAVWRAALQWAHESEAHPDVVQAIAGAAARLPEGFYGGKSGWVLVALQNAFWRLLHASSLEEGVVGSVMEGGDTDTNAAIAGALLGAVHGRSAVPARWRRTVLGCRALPGVAHPRPRALWPVDVEVLAERLLIAGRAAGAARAR